MNNFKHRVLRIEPNNTSVQKCALTVGVLNLHLEGFSAHRVYCCTKVCSCILIKNRGPEPGRDVKILSDRMLRIKGSAEHSRWTCVDRPSCSVDENLHNNAPHRK